MNSSQVKCKKALNANETYKNVKPNKDISATGGRQMELTQGVYGSLRRVSFHERSYFLLSCMRSEYIQGLK
jgi:hypothetical protein